MAAGIMAAPGTERGPCVTCEHVDCAQIREDAGRLCPICDKPIGYDTRFYVQRPDELTHADCLEDAVDAEKGRP